MRTMSVSSSARSRFSLRHLLGAALVAALVAAVSNLLVFGIGTALGVNFVFPMGPAGSPAQPLTGGMVIAASVIPAFAAAVLLIALSYVTTHPVGVFQIVALGLGLLSLGGPASLPVALATKLALSTMHVVAAVAIVGVLRRAAREK